MRHYKWQGGEYEKCRARVRRMSRTELLDWADVAGSGMAKGFMDYRKHGVVDSLEEIRLSLVQLAALVEELRERDAE